MNGLGLEWAHHVLGQVAAVHVKVPQYRFRL